MPAPREPHNLRCKQRVCVCVCVRARVCTYVRVCTCVGYGGGGRDGACVEGVTQYIEFAYGSGLGRHPDVKPFISNNVLDLREIY